ncbi:MAG TPA: hypothetical protein VNJ52_07130, partial [Patescibacteria group bacterium]|nr:hypothetical protein [Patescibacteria group bacterium]
MNVRRGFRWILVLGGVIFFCLPGRSVSRRANSLSPPALLDRFGGVTGAPCRLPATGYFHLEIANRRWLLCTPLGHAFWMLSVYQVDWTTGGAAYSTAVQNKYGGSQAWAAQATARLKSWGFNAIGPESGVGSHNVL